SGQQLVAAQHRTELFNALGGPARQVGEGSVLGFAGLAVALPQQDGRRRASVRDDSHIHAPKQSQSAVPCQPEIAILHDFDNREYQVFSVASLKTWSKFGLNGTPRPRWSTPAEAHR